MGARRVVGPEEWGPKISLFFFLLLPVISIFHLSLWGSARGILVVFWSARTSNVLVFAPTLFFESEEMKESHRMEWQKSKASGTDPTRLKRPGSRQPSGPKLPDHGGRGCTICTLRTTEIQQGRGHSPGGDTGEHGRPPQAPSLFHPLPHQDGF